MLSVGFEVLPSKAEVQQVDAAELLEVAVDGAADGKVRRVDGPVAEAQLVEILQGVETLAADAEAAGRGELAVLGLLAQCLEVLSAEGHHDPVEVVHDAALQQPTETLGVGGLGLHLEKNEGLEAEDRGRGALLLDLQRRLMSLLLVFHHVDRVEAELRVDLAHNFPLLTHKGARLQRLDLCRELLPPRDQVIRALGVRVGHIPVGFIVLSYHFLLKRAGDCFDPLTESTV